MKNMTRETVQKNKGFTLIELMIVVAIVGILAAIALPAFTTYIKRSKTSEASTSLAAMFTGVATYYTVERNATATTGGTVGQSISYCRVDDAVSSATTPTGIKVPGPELNTVAGNGLTWSAIGFQPGDPLYYRYSTARTGVAATACGAAAGTLTTPQPAYNLTATGDLDGDAAGVVTGALVSSFTLAVSADANNSLRRAPTLDIINELE